MKFKFEPADYCPCSAEKFYINQISASISDFGEGHDCDGPEPYPNFIGCVNYKFFIKEPTQEVLDRYYITEDEYWEIANYLESKLSFGECSCCE